MTKTSSIEVGDIYEDLDRRARGRRFKVVNVFPHRVQVKNVVGNRQRSIKRERLTNENLYRRVRVDEPKMVPEPTAAE